MYSLRNQNPHFDCPELWVRLHNVRIVLNPEADTFTSEVFSSCSHLRSLAAARVKLSRREGPACPPGCEKLLEEGVWDRHEQGLAPEGSTLRGPSWTHAQCRRDRNTVCSVQPALPRRGFPAARRWPGAQTLPQGPSQASGGRVALLLCRGRAYTCTHTELGMRGSWPRPLAWVSQPTPPARPSPPSRVSARCLRHQL